MTKRINAKHKVDRRLRVNLWGRPKSPFNTRNYPPGQHGQAKKSKPTDYGVQLNAKQKLKSYYGNINERQFRNIYRKALSKKGDTTENLIALLESRLDTIIYRAKFAPTVFSARQLINHGHIKVNKKRVNISSYVVKNTDLIDHCSPCRGPDCKNNRKTGYCLKEISSSFIDSRVKNITKS